MIAIGGFLISDRRDVVKESQSHFHPIATRLSLFGDRERERERAACVDRLGERERERALFRRARERVATGDRSRWRVRSPVLAAPCEDIAQTVEKKGSSESRRQRITQHGIDCK